MKKTDWEDWIFDLEVRAASCPTEEPASHQIPESDVKSLCLITGIRWGQSFRSWYECSASILASELIADTKLKSETKQRIEFFRQATLDPSNIVQAYVRNKLHEDEWLYGDKWEAPFHGLRTILLKYYGTDLGGKISLQDTADLLNECRSHFHITHQAEIKLAAKRGRKKSKPLERAMTDVCRMADLHGLKLTLPANEVASVDEASTPLFILANSLVEHASLKLNLSINCRTGTAFPDNTALKTVADWLKHLSPRTLLVYLRQEVRVIQAQNSLLQAHQFPPHTPAETRAFNSTDQMSSEEIQSCSKPEPSGSTRSLSTPR